MRWFALLGLVVGLVVAPGCYAPAVPSGAPCAASGACPHELVCVEPSHTCEPDGSHGVVDAALDGDGGRDDATDATACTPAPSGMMMFAFTGAITTFTVPTCGPIRIEAWGAQGGNGFATNIGGKGAHVAGTFTLAKGTPLAILVGGQGLAGTNGTSQRGGTGGGGSFVVQGVQTPLVIAGGGGGAAGGNFQLADGGPGQATTSGQDGNGVTGDGTMGGAGGTAGMGGTTFQHVNPSVGTYQQSTAGGGLLTDATASSNGGAGNGTPNGPGKAFVNGGAGGLGGSAGRNGGFGGGGASGYSGGGGGGYSGGGNAAGQVTTYAGGGGGSFGGGTTPVLEAGINTGNGRVTITW